MYISHDQSSPKPWKVTTVLNQAIMPLKQPKNIYAKSEDVVDISRNFALIARTLTIRQSPK